MAKQVIKSEKYPYCKVLSNIVKNRNIEMHYMKEIKNTGFVLFVIPGEEVSS